MDLKKLLRKIFILLTVLSLLPPCGAFSAYTLDTVYGVHDEDTPRKPYFLHNFGLFPNEPSEMLLQKQSIIFHRNQNEASVNIGAELMPINSKKYPISYSSSDETVAKVDDKGNVTSMNKLGSAVITASGGGQNAECVVSVVIGVESIKIDRAPARLYADKPVATQLSAVISPSDATIKDVIWSTSDSSIATIDRTGMLIPCGVGTVTVSTKTCDGSYTAQAVVEVDVWRTRTVNAKAKFNYTKYPYTLGEIIEIQNASSPTVFTTNAFAAEEEEVRFYADPSNFTSGEQLYQFLNLSSSSGISADVLDDYLSGKGVLSDMGEVFVSAAEKYKLNEVYLTVHSCLETGNGMSELANGVEYNGTTVYNMFGIGAIDSDPIGGGAKYAYDNGWTSVEKAIDGGAEWIGTYYINNKDCPQNTLYKMRWNPENPGVHQYATDVQWAYKQAQTLKNMFAAFPDAKLSFDYPLYSGESEPNLSLD